MPTTTRATTNADYTEINSIPIYTPMYMLLSMLVGGRRVLNALISRWSVQGDFTGSSEQASKTLGAHRRDVPAVEALLASVPDEDWNTAHGRAKHNIVAVTTAHVTPFRSTSDPRGSLVIGYLIFVQDTLFYRVSSSGYKTIDRPDGDVVNPYTQSVIELLKFAVATGDGSERVALRLAEDRTRKGRHLAELTRLNDWLDRLRIRLFYGTQEMDFAGFGRQMEHFTDGDNQKQRDETVAKVTLGILHATHKGLIPMSANNLPPVLQHIEDPDAAGFDRRKRIGTHLAVEWAVEVFPALDAYTRAFARGAGPKELAEILRRYKVPTPRQLPSSDGKIRYSALRDTTFDQLDGPEAGRRALRWLMYGDYRWRPVDDATPEDDRAEIETINALALRKVQLVRSGEFTYVYTNPTPTTDRLGEFEVERARPLDAGRFREVLQFDWPPKRKVVVNADGIAVVTEDLELDEHGNVIAWEYCGCDPEVLDQCMERIRSIGTEGSRRRAEVPAADATARVLDIDRWTTVEDDGSVRQWEMWCRGTTDNGRAGSRKGHWRTRWLLWRPAPQPEVPEADLNLRWSVDHDDAILDRSKRKNPDRHVATVREGALLMSVYEQLRDSLLAVLDEGQPLALAPTGAAAGQRAARHRALLTQADVADGTASENHFAADGAEKVALLQLGKGNDAEYERMTAMACRLRAEADEKEATARELRATAEKLADVEEADISVTNVAHLLELMRRAAAEADGYLPQHLASMIGGQFSQWRARVVDVMVEWSCTARLPLVDGRWVTLELTGEVANTSYGHNARGEGAEGKRHRAQLLRQLFAGRSLDQIAVDGEFANRSTTRESLYRSARKGLCESGLASTMAGVILDHPHTAAIVAVNAALTNERPASYEWGPAFEQHMKSIYCDDNRRWAKAACPTSHSLSILRVFEVLRQHPTGVGVSDVAAAADVTSDFIAGLVTNNRNGKDAVAWPQMLDWVDGHTGRAVKALACPHRDCTAKNGWATIPVFLPETCPEPGGVGGVLCPYCSRVPRTDMARIVFPSAWKQPIAAAVDGRHGARKGSITEVVQLPQVPNVQAFEPPVRIEDLVAEFGWSRATIKRILTSVGVHAVRARGAGAHGVLLYPPAARTALAAWAESDPEADGSAVRLATLADDYGLSRCYIGEILDRADVKPLVQRARGKGGGALYDATEARTALSRVGDARRDR